MTTTGSDITVVLSGGTTNINVNDSLGGDPSAAPVVTSALNNLFADISSEESADGKEDYRCIYIFNDGDTPIYDLEVWIYEDYTDGATMEIGIKEQDESQRITITGDQVTGGKVTLSYGTVSFDSEYNSDLSVWSSTLEETLLDLINPTTEDPFFKSLNVVAENSGSDTLIFNINFSAKDGKRNFEKINVESNELVPLGAINVIITAPQEGSPINTIAPEINVETTPPGGVSFFAATETSAISLPRLAPSEGFPLWIKRVIPAGTTAQESDGFRIRMRAESLET